MPKLIVNLAGTEGQRSPYMELELTLESSTTATFKRVPELMPRLKDQLTTFLRELRVEDLNGSTGTWRLRRELLNRFNTVMDPKKIDAVLIESMLIQ
jgi:flagellar FliL protein